MWFRIILSLLILSLCMYVNILKGHSVSRFLWLKLIQINSRKELPEKHTPECKMMFCIDFSSSVTSSIFEARYNAGTIHWLVQQLFPSWACGPWVCNHNLSLPPQKLKWEGTEKYRGTLDWSTVKQWTHWISLSSPENMEWHLKWFTISGQNSESGMDIVVELL